MIEKLSGIQIKKKGMPTKTIKLENKKNQSKPANNKVAKKEE